MQFALPDGSIARFSCFDASILFFRKSHPIIGQMDPHKGPKWVRTQMGPAPTGPGPKWAPGPDPNESGPKWARAPNGPWARIQMGPDPNGPGPQMGPGPGPKWARAKAILSHGAMLAQASTKLESQIHQRIIRGVSNPTVVRLRILNPNGDLINI